MGVGEVLVHKQLLSISHLLMQCYAALCVGVYDFKKHSIF